MSQSLLCNLPPFRMKGSQTGLRRPVLSLGTGIAFLLSVASASAEWPYWKGTALNGSPDPEPRFQLTRLWSDWTFDEPVELDSRADFPYLIVAERKGPIYALRWDGSDRKVLGNFKEWYPKLDAVYGWAFHPNFRENHLVYVCYVLQGQEPDGTRVSRFKLDVKDGAPTLIPESEKVLITWLGGGHNGGCLRFGPDGFLYISTGDGAGPVPPDSLKTGQDISDLLSSVLRIDVNQEEDGMPYGIPVDNPFKTVPGARSEIWAFGFRNPWKMSFDEHSGDLWVGDVGWELWELIFKVQRGGNYGWSIQEGRQMVQPNLVKGPGPLLMPLVDHPHSEAASITGGWVYRGKNLRTLTGRYIYGDWETGKIWSALEEASGNILVDELLDSTLKIIAFGKDPGGELLVMDYGGGIYRLDKSPKAVLGPPRFPFLLSQAEIFSELNQLTPQEGIREYTVAAERWVDGAHSVRHFGWTSGKATWERNRMQFPEGAVFVKTFFFPDHGVEGDLKSARKVETQILKLWDGIWRMYSYRWRDDQSDAELVGGLGEDHVLPDRMENRSVVSNQVWHYSSRADCARCHNPWVGPVLGFHPMQLSGEISKVDFTWDKLVENGAVEVRGRRTQLPPALCSPQDSKCDLDLRARSYLHVQCSACHTLNAGGSVPSLLNYPLPLKETLTVSQPPSQGTLGLDGARVIVPGVPEKSVLYARMAKAGHGRMPKIGNSLWDEDGLDLIYQWIGSMGSGAGDVDGTVPTPWRREVAEAITSMKASGSEAGKSLKALVQSPEHLMYALALRAPGEGRDQLKGALKQVELTSVNGLVRDILGRLSPVSQQMAEVTLDALRGKEGNAARGEELFFVEGGRQCGVCHRVGDKGGEIGPELSKIGGLRSLEELWSSLKNPSEKIEGRYRAYSVETREGMVFLGFIVSESQDWIDIRSVTGETQRVERASIVTLEPQAVSTMPEGLLEGLSAQEVADLLAYLVSLR